MSSVKTKEMGKVTTTITVANLVDQIMAERGFISVDEVRSVTLENVLVDTGASRLCLPAEIVAQLGLTMAGEVEVKTAVGARKVRVFKGVSLSVEGREGTFDCVELPESEDPLLGLIPLEDLGLEPDLQNQRLRLLPNQGKDTYLMVL
jgi:predicted aspartyl protease